MQNKEHGYQKCAGQVPRYIIQQEEYGNGIKDMEYYFNQVEIMDVKGKTLGDGNRRSQNKNRDQP